MKPLQMSMMYEVLNIDLFETGTKKKKKIIAALFASCGKSQPASLFWFLLTFP